MYPSAPAGRECRCIAAALRWRRIARTDAADDEAVAHADARAERAELLGDLHG